MSHPHLTDSEILQGIHSPAPQARQEVLRAFFRQSEVTRRQIAAHVARWDGTKEDVNNVIADAMATFDRQIRDGKFKGESSLSTFFFGIAENHWKDRFKKKRREREKAKATVPIADNPNIHGAVGNVEDTYLSEERAQLLRQAIKQLAPRCQAVLERSMLGLSNQEIAQQVGLSSEAMAKKEGYRCRMKLRDYINSIPALRAVLNPKEHKESDSAPNP